MNSLQSESGVTIFSLSDEILLNIIHYLKMYDIVRLSESSQRFQRFLYDRTICTNLLIPWNIGKSRSWTIAFIKHTSPFITSLTLSNITWIHSYLIMTIVLKLKLLKGLDVAGTSFSWAHLHKVLQSPLPILNKLSWTYDNKLEKSIQKERDTNIRSQCRIYDELVLLCEKFQQFNYVLFHVNTRLTPQLYPRILEGISYILSLCTNIEECWVLGKPNMGGAISISGSPMNEWNVDYSKIHFSNLHTLVLKLETLNNFLPQIVPVLLTSFQKNNVRNINKDLIHPVMKLWIDPPACVRERGLHLIPASLSYNLSNLSWFSYLVGISETNINLSQLKKCDLRHPFPYGKQIHKLLENAPNLESLRCVSITQIDWSQIPLYNSHLKELIVNEEMFTDMRDSKFKDDCVYIAKLSSLQKITLPAACLLTIPEIKIRKYNSDQETSEFRPEDGTMRTTKQLKVNHQPTTGLDLLTLNCHNVEQFRLGHKNCNHEISHFPNITDALSNISRWIHLEYLTLSHLPLKDDGQFLIKIAESCKLKSLHLEYLGPRHHLTTKCCYTKSLYTALKLMPHLKDFSLNQHYIGSTTPLFEALETCRKLQRLTVFETVNNDSNNYSFPLEDSSGVLKLMNACHDLFLLNLSLGSATKEFCKFLRQKIVAEYKSSRPALKVIVNNDISKDILFNNIHHCEIMQCDNEGCFNFFN